VVQPILRATPRAHAEDLMQRKEKPVRNLLKAILYCIAVAAVTVNAYGQQAIEVYKSPN
jgi:hypothetical protein